MAFKSTSSGQAFCIPLIQKGKNLTEVEFPTHCQSKQNNKNGWALRQKLTSRNFFNVMSRELKEKTMKKEQLLVKHALLPDLMKNFLA